MSFRLHVALAVLVFVLSGCAAGPVVVDATSLPNSLAGVNDLAANRTVVVELVDGGRIPFAEDLVVTRDDVRFTVGYVRDGGGRVGRSLGAASGLAYMGLGTVLFGAVAASGDGGIGTAIGVAVGASAAVGGAAVGAIGGAIGQAVGRSVSPWARVTFFQGPVERYAVSPPLPQ